jgi:hypothetical protein
MRDLNPRPTLSIMDPWGVRRRSLVPETYRKQADLGR